MHHAQPIDTLIFEPLLEITETQDRPFAELRRKETCLCLMPGLGLVLEQDMTAILNLGSYEDDVCRPHQRV